MRYKIFAKNGNGIVKLPSITAEHIEDALQKAIKKYRWKNGRLTDDKEVYLW